MWGPQYLEPISKFFSETDGQISSIDLEIKFFGLVVASEPGRDLALLHELVLYLRQTLVSEKKIRF